MLGEKWDYGDKEYRGMAFANSGIEHIKIPSTLQVIEAYTFYRCARLKSVEFSEGLEKIGAGAFARSGIEHVIFP